MHIDAQPIKTTSPAGFTRCDFARGEPTIYAESTAVACHGAFPIVTLSTLLLCGAQVVMHTNQLGRIRASTGRAEKAHRSGCGGRDSSAALMSRPPWCMCLCVWLRRRRERAGRGGWTCCVLCSESEGVWKYLRPRVIVVVACEPSGLVVRSECLVGLPTTLRACRLG